MTKTMTPAECLHCKRTAPIKARKLCSLCFDRSDVRRQYPLVRKFHEHRRGKCIECGETRCIMARKLCSRCHGDLAIRAKYPAITKQEQGRRFVQSQRDFRESNRMVGIHEELMPETVYAIVRRMRSPFSGKLLVMVGWYAKPGEARRIARKCCRHFACRVERWTRVAKHRMCDVPRRLQKRRGTMNYETVAVYPRRGGKRVAA